MVGSYFRRLQAQVQACQPQVLGEPPEDMNNALRLLVDAQIVHLIAADDALAETAQTP